MNMQQKIGAAVLAVLLLGASVLWWRTEPPSARAARKTAAELAASDMVDQSTYATAQRLAQSAPTPAESTYAQSALRVADHALALAFTSAVRETEAHPPALSADALKIQDRITKSQALLDADQQRVSDLNLLLGQAKSEKKDALQDELELAQSQLDLDKDELAEANQDLVDAGGNQQQRIEAMVQEHDAQMHARAAAPEPLAASVEAQHGALTHFRDWIRLHQKRQELDAAQTSASEKQSQLTAQRTDLASNLEKTKGGIAELASHTKSAKAQANATVLAPRLQHSHDAATALLGQTKSIAADQKILTLLDSRIGDQRQLQSIYARWADVVAAQLLILVHILMTSALIIILILLAVLFVDRWLQHLLNNPKLDRRQVETLRSLTRVTLRVVALVIIILIVIGVPSEFGTMLGIIGAGLTVALKDFIVAFFGWLMLMGRNGIRLGDWVEINGVSGEVTELGVFHTVLLETGNWSDAGHPTGRRVTFTNSFAIEGHYFNFSTSGQWLWDELQVVVPAGQDPYPIVESITQEVAEATADSARQAEQEWQRAVPAQRAKVFSGTPGVSVKPIVGGVEIAIRYITRANERFQLRGKLYQAAVDLLGGKTLAPTVPTLPPRT